MISLATVSCFQHGFHQEVFRLKLSVLRGPKIPWKKFGFLSIIVDKITHLSEVTGPCSVAFVVRNVRLTGTLGRYQVRKATYR